MELLRKHWIPQPGQGDQDFEYALHETLAATQKKIITSWKKQDRGKDQGAESPRWYGRP